MTEIHILPLPEALTRALLHRRHRPLKDRVPLLPYPVDGEPAWPDDVQHTPNGEIVRLYNAARRRVQQYVQAGWAMARTRRQYGRTIYYGRIVLTPLASDLLAVSLREAGLLITADERARFNAAQLEQLAVWADGRLSGQPQPCRLVDVLQRSPWRVRPGLARSIDWEVSRYCPHGHHRAHQCYQCDCAHGTE